MRLSVLDQSPVPSGSTAAEALRQTVALAQAAEELGYHRYWLAEHHGAPGLAGTSPEVLAARVAAATSTIRVGAGGVLLSHYSPLKVAENFRVLSRLFPGRIDLGIGRAEGASADTTTALQAGAAQAGVPFGKKLGELLAHLDEGSEHSEDSEGDTERPELWLLASSSEGATAAADLGLPLCFAHFISWGFAAQIVRRYHAGFRPGATGQAPRASAAVAVICADTDDEADRLASSVDIWRLSSEESRGPVPSPDEAWARGRTQLEAAQIKQRRQGLVVGGPDRVAAALTALAGDFGVDELVVLTVCHEPKARLRSYELLAGAFDL